jgi:hypothetical protein
MAGSGVPCGARQSNLGGPRVAPTLTHPQARRLGSDTDRIRTPQPQRQSSPGLPAELHEGLPLKRWSWGRWGAEPRWRATLLLPPLARLGEFFCEGPAPSSFSHSQRNWAGYRGDGLAFEPPGEPSGLRSTACPVPLACSSMLRVLPGLAAPLVVGDVGLVELPIAGLPEGLVP